MALVCWCGGLFWEGRVATRHLSQSGSGHWVCCSRVFREIGGRSRRISSSFVVLLGGGPRGSMIAAGYARWCGLGVGEDGSLYR